MDLVLWLTIHRLMNAWASLENFHYSTEFADRLTDNSMWTVDKNIHVVHDGWCIPLVEYHPLYPYAEPKVRKTKSKKKVTHGCINGTLTIKVEEIDMGRWGLGWGWPAESCLWVVDITVFHLCCSHGS